MNTEIMLSNNKIEIAKQTFPKELKNCNEANFEKLLKKIPITKFYKTISEISENKESALSLVPSKFSDIKIVNFKDSVIRTTIQEFFNINQEPIKNINFNDELTNFLKEHKNINNKDAASFGQCLTLLAHNGHDEGAKYVKTIFEANFIKFNNSLDELNNRISTEEENLQNISTVEPDNNSKIKILINTICKILINKHNNNTESKKAKIRKKIGVLESQKDNLINNYSPFFEQIIDFYNHFIQRRLSDNDFNNSVLTETFLRICEDLYKFSKDEEKQNIGDSSIQKTLDSIIPSLIQSISKVKTDSRKNLYIKLNIIYQDLFKFTSCIDTKMALLNAYINNPDFPIVRYIIDDALNNKINLQDKNKTLVINYIEKKYKQIHDNDEFDQDLDYLKEQNSAFIKNTNFPENIRKKAFNWYFNSEIIDNDKKNEFCWEIIDFIDKLDSLYDYNEIYDKCEEYLIINETEDKILKNLEKLMDSAVSNGRIVPFINGVYFYIQDNNFTTTADKYKTNLGIEETFHKYNRKAWKARERNKEKNKM